jgi:hypothetical protein
MALKIRRREFIAGAAWAAVTGHARLGAAPKSLGTTLLALAEVIVPDQDSTIWLKGNVTDTFLNGLESLDQSQKAELEKAVRTIEAEADRATGKSFSALNLQERTSIIKQKLAAGNGFRSGFWIVRTVAMRAFYASRTGRRRTGYHDTTQFDGYPQYVRAAETWE